MVVEPEELATIDVEATRTIDIEEFVDLADIDPVYFEKSYYLVPDGRAEKPYALLVEAMTRTGKVAIGRFVLRTKQYLATLRAHDGVLVLATMLYDDEVVAPTSSRCRRPRRPPPIEAGAGHGGAAGRVAVGPVRPEQVPR